MSKTMSIVCGLLLLIVTSTQTSAETRAEQKHQEWTSWIVDIGDQTRFRAYTGHREGSGSVALIFDRISQDCLIQHVSINIILPEPTNSTHNASKQYFGALRVDEALMHNITYTTGAAVGTKFDNQVVVVTVENFDKEATILEELQKGRNVRFKLGDDFYLRFSLSGFTNASKRSLQLCMGSNNENPDKNYFGAENTRIKDDKSYFRY